MDNQSKTKEELILEIENLQKKYEQMKMIADNASDVIWTMDSNLNYTYISPSIFKQRGYTPEEFLSLKQKDIYTDASIAKLMQVYEQHSKLSNLGKIPKDYNIILELEHKCKNGTIITGEVVINPLINEEGEIVGIHGTSRNLTERKKMEDMLLQQNNILNAVAKANFSLLLNEDFDSAIKDVLLNLGTTIGIDRIYISQTHKDAKTKKLLFSLKHEWTNNPLSSYIKNDNYKNVSFEEYAPNWYYIMCKGDSLNSPTNKLSFPERALLNEQGTLSILLVPIHIGVEFWGFIGFEDCNTERIWSEGEVSILKAVAASIGGTIKLARNKENLLKSKAEAEASDNFKTNLLLNMSHELRTPMNGILGFAEILCEELKDDKLELAKRISSSGKRLMKTLNTILELSQLESGVKTVEFSITNISDEINTAIKEHEELATKKNLEFVAIVRKDMSCYTEPFLFAKIVSNLIDNAVKFTKEGGIVVEAKIADINGKDCIEVKIKDSGIGIAPENREIIFNEFKQVSEGYGRSYEGVGLGLTLTIKMLNILGGTIDIESKLDVGSVFTVTIPCKRKLQPLPIENNDEIIEEKVVETPTVDLPLVLLVEDNEMNIDLTTSFLKNICRIDAATDATSAINLANDNTYEAILLDINLSSDQDGIYVLNEIQKIDRFNGVPVIAVTGYTMFGDKERLLKAGCTHYLAKPFSKIEIINLIKEVLKK